jgi:putative DNA primase/helicase
MLSTGFVGCASELPGIMNWVLQGRERLLKQNAFTESRVMANALDDYKSKYTKKVTSRIKLLLPPYL